MNIEQQNIEWWIGQVIGLLAFFVTGLAFFQKDEKKLKTILTISGLFWMANFWFLNSHTSFYITMINTIRQMVSRVYHDAEYEKRLKLSYVFVVITIIGGILSWHSWISFFPTFAAALTTVSLFIWESKKMRTGLLISEICWTINNIYYMNIGGLLADALNIPILISHIIKKDSITLIEKDS